MLQSLRQLKKDLNRKFKVSLNPWNKIFLNFAKVTSHSAHQNFDKYQNFHCAVFEIEAL